MTCESFSLCLDSVSKLYGNAPNSSKFKEDSRMAEDYFLKLKGYIMPALSIYARGQLCWNALFRNEMFTFRINADLRTIRLEPPLPQYHPILDFKSLQRITILKISLWKLGTYRRNAVGLWLLLLLVMPLLLLLAFPLALLLLLPMLVPPTDVALPPALLSFSTVLDVEDVTEGSLDAGNGSKLKYCWWRPNGRWSCSSWRCWRCCWWHWCW